LIGSNFYRGPECRAGGSKKIGGGRQVVELLAIERKAGPPLLNEIERGGSRKLVAR
jgi:hypothetical protein